MTTRKENATNLPPTRKTLSGRKKENQQSQNRSQNQELYVRETIKSSIRSSFKMSAIAPRYLDIGATRKQKLVELQTQLCGEDEHCEQTLLNMAWRLGYREAQYHQLTPQQARHYLTLDCSEKIEFKINDEEILNLLLESGLENALTIYLNLGIDVMYVRLLTSHDLPNPYPDSIQ
ncbi:hypothetical protein NEA10_04910 [Phormidium yuhuli AB48]|uniref:Uncharacterized protein n=1 Tax=Phormidium yuhuli AB48 TaxID=2940671 RepID=A0ABY5AUP7_9CYAN|nr:hypothetical protein [Phormidium yuhuli]USR92066.1 hypothetical protein NEA10_04910 [Phormidium yuhuli AB48]